MLIPKKSLEKCRVLSKYVSVSYYYLLLIKWLPCANIYTGYFAYIIVLYNFETIFLCRIS